MLHYASEVKRSRLNEVGPVGLSGRPRAPGIDWPNHFDTAPQGQSKSNALFAERKFIMADDIEIEVTIPDEDTDSDNDGQSNDFEAGVASEKAESAEETAESADIKADVALDIAGITAESNEEFRQRIATQDQIIARQTEQITELQMAISGLVEITTNLANVALADKESEEFQELPPDETPENKHWLNRKLF